MDMDISLNSGSISGLGLVDANASSEDPFFMASQFASTVSSGDAVSPQNFDECSKEMTATAQAFTLQEGALGGDDVAQSCTSPGSLNRGEAITGAKETFEDPNKSHETKNSDVPDLQVHESPKREESLVVDGWPSLSLCEERTSSMNNEALPANCAIQITEISPVEPIGVLTSVVAEDGAMHEQGFRGSSRMEEAIVTEEPASMDVSAVLEESIRIDTNSMQTGDEGTNTVAQRHKGNSSIEVAVVAEPASTNLLSDAFEKNIMNKTDTMQTGDEATDLAEEGYRGNKLTDLPTIVDPASTALSAVVEKNIMNTANSKHMQDEVRDAGDIRPKGAFEEVPTLVLHKSDLQDQGRFRGISHVEVAVKEDPAPTELYAVVDESIISNTDTVQTGEVVKDAVDAMQNKVENPSALGFHDMDFEDQAGVIAPSLGPIDVSQTSSFAKDEKPHTTSISAIDLFETASISELQNMLMDSSLKHPEIASSFDKAIVGKEEDGSEISFVQKPLGGHLQGVNAVVKGEVKEESYVSSPNENVLNSVMNRGPDEHGLDAVQQMNDCFAIIGPQETEDNRATETMDQEDLNPVEAFGVGDPQNLHTESILTAENSVEGSNDDNLTRETEGEKASKDSVKAATTINESMEVDKEIQGAEVLLEDVPKHEAQMESEVIPADDVFQGPPQVRKRGRKPGRKAVKHMDKDARIGMSQEFETEKEPGDSPQKHSTGIEPKRELRKRGRKPVAAKVVQKEEEDVCFVCFDGGKLILCDKRSCPKAYHVECTGRESEFFEKKGQWFCGWHVCSQCSKSANLNCYMCPTALCSNCVKGGNFLCIQKGRGLCEGCYPLVHMIEYKESVKGDPVQVDFNDKETYEGLFKEYWEEVKVKHSLSSAEFERACKAKEAGGIFAEGDVNYDESAMSFDAEETIGDENVGSTDSEDRPPTIRHARLMKRKRLTRRSVVEDASVSELEEEESDDEVKLESTPKKGRTRAPEFDGWASKELSDVIRSLKEDPKKPLPLFGVKKLLWRYIDDNKLTNPRRRGQILCDERLRKLFGKKLVGRFEMMKLISLHVASPNKSMASRSGEMLYNDDAVELDDIEDNQIGKKKVRRKGDEKRSKPDPSEYAAINVKNINLIYLKRSVLDELRNDPELETKAIGAFVRIRVPGSANKLDACYRLVQVIGVKQIYDALDPEKVTDVILEIQNLHKREEVTADLVSNQELVEEECQRLRQSVRCGLIQPMKVGELEERARSLREAKVKDWREFELLRLSHLRDRASEKGRKKELRECVEKLQLLSTPEEKERLLNAPFDIDADPFMDPAYESEEDDSPSDDGPGEMSAPQNVQEKFFPNRFPERVNNSVSSEKPYNYRDSGSSLESHKIALDTHHKTFVGGHKDPLISVNARQTADLPAQGWTSLLDTPIDKSVTGQSKAGWGDGPRGRDQMAGWNHGLSGRKEMRWNSNFGGNGPSIGGGARRSENADAMPRFAGNQPDIAEERSSGPVFSPIQAPNPAAAVTPFFPPANTGTMGIDIEKEKVWCYLDPTRTVQGPFTMEQLRKWEKTNLFPVDLHIWRATESQDTAVLLSDALAGKFAGRRFVGSSPRLNFPPGSAQGNHVGSIPVQGLMGQNGGTLTGSAQGNVTSSMPPPQGPAIQGFPSSAQGLNAQNFTPRPMQGPNPQGFSSATPARAPNVHRFPTVPAQGTNVHTFGPAPTQGPYVNSFPAAPLQGTPIQGPNVTGYPPNVAQGANNVPGQIQPPLMMQGRPQGPNIVHGHMQGPVAHAAQAQMPNVSQGSHFSNAQVSHPPHGPHANRFPMGANPGAMHSNTPQIRHSNDWQDMDRRVGPDPHFGGPSSNVRGAPNDGGARGIANRNSWRQGPGAPHQDHRDPHNRGQFGRSQSFRGSDQSQGSDSRFLPKKDLFCKYFSRGLCRKGQSCDFRHE